jgi:hypothetical protein
MADNPRHHKEFGAQPRAVRLRHQRGRRRDPVLVQEFLRQGLRADVVVAEYASTRGRYPHNVFACVPGDLRVEHQALARPAHGAIGHP